jgi:DNA-binding MarR family transcriptional regulator
VLPAFHCYLDLPHYITLLYSQGMLQSGKALTRLDAVDLVSTTLLGRASRLTRLLLRSGSRELTRTETGLLTTLADGPRRITELAETEAVSQPAISKMADKLEAQGLVVRARSADDGRAVQVSITAEGRARLELVHSQIHALLRRTLAELQDDDLAALVAAADVLERLIQALQNVGARG